MNIGEIGNIGGIKISHIKDRYIITLGNKTVSKNVFTKVNKPMMSDKRVRTYCDRENDLLIQHNVTSIFLIACEFTMKMNNVYGRTIKVSNDYNSFVRHFEAMTDYRYIILSPNSKAGKIDIYIFGNRTVYVWNFDGYKETLDGFNDTKVQAIYE